LSESPDQEGSGLINDEPAREAHPPIDIGSNPNNNSSSSMLEACADRIVFMGDMNYRIQGTRSAVDALLFDNMHAELLQKDQLTLSRQEGLVFQNYEEPPLHFRPTYKFDVGLDVYDSSSKLRVPAWTDRILHSTSGVKCIAYGADFTLRTSDHRPVFASFEIGVGFLEHHVHEANKRKATEEGPGFESVSQVCIVA